MGPSDADYRHLEESLGHHFKHRELLIQALTHRSYAYEHPEVETNNERLEFLGDAVFQFVVADELFTRFHDAPEGKLTPLRAALVSTAGLAAIGEELHLADFVRASRGEATLEGRGRQSILADAVEALVAAVYRDAGIRTARKVVRRLIVPRIGDAELERLEGNAKGRLQERIQASQGITPFYRVVDRSGPVHAEHFVVEVVAGDRVLGTGEGIGKREAEQHAARAALSALADPAADDTHAAHNDAHPPGGTGQRS